MKKRLFILLLCIFSLGLGGCIFDRVESQKLQVPTQVTVVDSGDRKILKFDSVKYCDRYIIKIEGVEYSSRTNSFDCTDIFSELKNYFIQVKAVSNGYHTDSEYSEIYRYSHTVTLATPVLTINGNTVSWTNIPNAEIYTVKIQKLVNGENVLVGTYPTDENVFNFSNHIQTAGLFSFSVQASASNVRIYDSAWSQTVNFQKYLSLAKPTGLTANIQSDRSKCELNFAINTNAKNYELTINGNKHILSASSVTNGKIDLLALGYDFSSAGVYQITLTALAYDYYLDSPTSDTYNLIINDIKLHTPEITNVTEEDEYYYVVWTADSRCQTFTIKINSEVYKTAITSTSVIIPKSDVIGDSIFVSVIAEAYGYYLNSDESTVVSSVHTDMLDTPTNITINADKVLTFDPVPRANGYVVRIDGTSYNFDTNTADISEYITVGKQYSIQVKAIKIALTTSDKYNESDFSDVYHYDHYKVALSPANLHFGSGAERYMLYFDMVSEGTDGYSLAITDSNNETTYQTINSSPVDVSYFLTTDGLYTVRLKSLALNEYYSDSAWSSDATCTFITKLDQPTNVVFADQKISFDPVLFASSYTVRVNDAEYVTNTTTMDLSTCFVVAQRYIICVKANANEQDFFTDSEYSYAEPYDYYLPLTKAKNITVSLISNTYRVDFDTVNNAGGYVLTLTNTDTGVSVTTDTISSLPCDITHYLTSAGNMTITVTALGVTEYYTTSVSDVVSFTTEPLYASVVTGLSIKHTANAITAVWDESDFSNGYRIELNGSLLDAKYIGTSYTLTELFLDEGTYVLKVSACGYGYYLSSAVSTYRYDYTYTYRADFARHKVFMYGEYWDYDIDSYTNFMYVNWHQFLFRLGTTRLYISNVDAIIREYNALPNIKYQISTTSIDTIRIKSLTEWTCALYPEYCSISDIIVTANGNIFTIKFTNQMANDCTATFREEYPDYVTTSTNPVNYSGGVKTYTDRGYSWDEFAINARDEIVVSNSEQLFMVVQYGKQPVFSKNCVAKTIYNNAKSILRQIIRNDMTDLEKIVAIFDWVQSTNVYDYELLEYTSNEGGLVSEVGHYRDFYLEGILYDLDNSLAVCDGIAKTFTLLCNMEGIDSIKVNGDAGGGHAWSKVKLDGVWYFVDATWADKKYEGVEYPTHWYFLESDMRNSDHVIEYPTDAEFDALVDYDYYSHVYYSYNGATKDWSVSSVSEYKHLMNYIKSLYDAEVAQYGTSSTKVRKVYDFGLDMDIKNDTQLRNVLQNASFTFSYSVNDDYTKILIFL